VGCVTINTSGTVNYIMDGNSYLGTTTIANGTLILDTTDSSVPLTTSSGNLLAINGPLVIGDGTGSANTAILQMGATVPDSARYTISANTSVTINSDGLFYVNGQDQVIGSLTMNGGNINTTDAPDGNHANTIYGLLGLNGNATILANANSSTISGNFNMQNAVGNTTTGFNVASGGNTSGDLIISALLSGGSMVKSGTGNMVLSSNLNTYTGTTEVQAGILNIQAANALGATDGTTGEGTTVDSGAQLQMEGGIAVGNEYLTLNGNGTGSSDGALQNKSGDNSWAGNVSAASNATINTTANSLYISGNVSTSASNTTLTFNGNGDTTISGNITGGLNIVKNGSGTLMFNGTSTNGYTGNTTVNAGTLELNKTGGTVAVSGSTITINSGGTLLSDTSENVGNAVNMVLNGGTWVTNGASAGSWTENLNTLTLTATSNLTLGANSNVVAFANSSSTTWAGDSILYINSWDGSLLGAGTDQVFFGTSSAGLQGTSYTGQLGEIIFVNPTIDGVATTSNFHAVILSTGEVVPFRAAPEPGTVAAGAALGALALLRELRRRKALVAVKKK
jgi:autotransporter-associated beta strand protein